MSAKLPSNQSLSWHFGFCLQRYQEPSLFRDVVWSGPTVTIGRIAVARFGS